MKNYLNYLFIVFCLASCSGSNSNNLQNDSGPATELTGNWERKCQAGGIGYDNALMQFGGSVFAMEGAVYKNFDCTELLYTQKATGTYLLGNPYFAGKEINTEYTSGEFTAKAQSQVDFFNYVKLCGFTDWKLDETRSCPSLLSKHFQIFQIENSKLLFGKTSKQYDAKSSEKRPHEIDSTYYFSR